MDPIDRLIVLFYKIGKAKRNNKPTLNYLMEALKLYVINYEQAVEEDLTTDIFSSKLSITHGIIKDAELYESFSGELEKLLDSEEFVKRFAKRDLQHLILTYSKSQCKNATNFDVVKKLYDLYKNKWIGDIDDGFFIRKFFNWVFEEETDYSWTSSINDRKLKLLHLFFAKITPTTLVQLGPFDYKKTHLSEIAEHTELFFKSSKFTSHMIDSKNEEEPRLVELYMLPTTKLEVLIKKEKFVEALLMYINNLEFIKNSDFSASLQEGPIRLATKQTDFPQNLLNLLSSEFFMKNLQKNELSQMIFGCCESWDRYGEKSFLDTIKILFGIYKSAWSSDKEDNEFITALFQKYMFNGYKYIPRVKILDALFQKIQSTNVLKISLSNKDEAPLYEHALSQALKNNVDNCINYMFAEIRRLQKSKHYMDDFLIKQISTDRWEMLKNENHVAWRILSTIPAKKLREHKDIDALGELISVKDHPNLFYFKTKIIEDKLSKRQIELFKISQTALDYPLTKKPRIAPP